MTPSRAALIVLFLTIPFLSAPTARADFCAPSERNDIGIWDDLLNRYVNKDPDLKYLCGPLKAKNWPVITSSPSPVTNTTIPDAIAPPSDVSLLFSLRAQGVRHYECRPTSDTAAAWVDQVSRFCFFDTRAGSENDAVGAGLLNPTKPGSAFYGALKGKTAVQGHQAANVPTPEGDPNKDLSWEIVTTDAHYYADNLSTAKFDFRRVTAANRILTNGGKVPSSNVCTIATAGAKLVIPFEAHYRFYGKTSFVCPWV